MTIMGSSILRINVVVLKLTLASDSGSITHWVSDILRIWLSFLRSQLLYPEKGNDILQGYTMVCTHYIK